MSEMKEGGWEYFMKEFDPSDIATVELWLNHQGTSGWELVTVIPGPSGKRFVAFMKRPRWTKEEGAVL
jgi:hypothetical protein